MVFYFQFDSLFENFFCFFWLIQRKLLSGQRFALKSYLCSGLQKKVSMCSQKCRTALIRSALESPDHGASNGGSNFEIRHFGADLAAFEVAVCTRMSRNQLLGQQFPGAEHFQKFEHLFAAFLVCIFVILADHALLKILSTK